MNSIENSQAYRIVFMGTPGFAVPALKALHESKHEVLMVVTQPDRKKGRGRKLAAPPVKSTALELGYEVFQPESVKTDEFAEAILKLNPDLLLVIAFGQIIPKAVLRAADRGAINLHASLLPKYRGPAPIQWAIINREKETGVTTMFMDEGLDTGDMLLSQPVEIGERETSGTLHDRLADVGADLVLETLGKLATGILSPVPQDERHSTYAPLLKKQDGRIDWTRPAKEIESFIRGVNPWPGAFTFCDDRRLKIYTAQYLDMDTTADPGTVLVGFPCELRVATGQGALVLEEIQGASGKCLLTKDFLCGCHIAPGTRLRNYERHRPPKRT
ncbi:MAG: methionyl-tRNA formyltransferase [Deltaproteobacteria bacterium]|nr:methionyl-tRNA formyltransferase [Deltaproteobacteria bacterium]MBW2634784.1 methionyl-tRNA formyltransferase [Deltaproteobacteria bacterium]MBW2676135.1 methionyl-tRNA formyltransferase [Deltaproteobacteria bacterium]